jgi:MoxR-like ATPase
VKGLKLVAGAALLRHSTVAELQDLWPLNYVWSRPEEAEAAKTVIQPKVQEGGGAPLRLARDAADLMDDITTLESQESRLRGEVAIGAHLMALNRLRREILMDHRSNTVLTQRIEGVIERNIAALEGLYHV